MWAEVVTRRVFEFFMGTCVPAVRDQIESDREPRHVYHSIIIQVLYSNIIRARVLHLRRNVASGSNVNSLAPREVRSPALPSSHVNAVSVFITPVHRVFRTRLRPSRDRPARDHALMSHHASRWLYLRTLYRASLPCVHGVHPPSRLPTFSRSLSRFLSIPSLSHDMRHIRKLKNKVKSKFGGGSDSEQLSSGSTPRTSNDSTKPDTRSGKPTARRGLSRQGLPQNTSIAQISSRSSPDHPPEPTPVAIQNPEASRSHSTEPSESPGPSTKHPVLEKPFPADAPVDSPDSSATLSSPLAPSHHGWPDFKKSAKGALLTVLKIAEKASAPLPPLQTALGTVVASVEIYNVSRGLPTSEMYNLMAFVDRNITQTKRQFASSTVAFAP